MFAPGHGLTPIPRSLVDQLLTENRHFRQAILDELVVEERP
jgi:hypothetical protein